MTVLLLNPIAMPDAELAGWVTRLLVALDPGTVVHTGRDDYTKWFPFEGSWEAWASGAASRYEAIVALGAPGVIAAGARAVINAALRRGKPCWAWDGTTWWPLVAA